MSTSPFGNIQTQYASVGSNVAGAAGTGGYGAYSMNAGDFVYSLMPYMWSKFIPALRARGLPFKHILDVSETVATTGATAKVTVAQNLTANNLSDGAIRVLDDTPPLVAEVTLADDITVSFGLTDVVNSFINKQPTLPAVVAGALTGLLNSIEEQFVTDIVANVPAANVVGTYNTPLTATTLSSAQSVLVQNFVPQVDDMFYGLLAPYPNAWDQLVSIPTIVWTQTRWSPTGTGGENSEVVSPGSRYGQDVQYLGGRWSQSTLAPTVMVSGAPYSSNVIWNRFALAAAVRPPEKPMPGIGAIAENFIDAASGLALQMLHTYNYSTLVQEMTLRTIIGDAPGQPLWSVLLRS